MKQMNWIEIGSEDPRKHHAKDTLLIVLHSGPNEEHSKWVDELETKAIPVMEKRLEYIKAYCGFANDKSAPFAIIRWLKDGNGTFERRWLLGHFIKRIRTQFESIKKLAVVIANDTPSKLDIAMAEDIYSSICNHLFDSLKIKSCDILVRDIKQIEKKDPYFRDRFSYNLNYRFWINENPDIRTSIKIGEDLKSFAMQHSCDFQEMTESELQKEGMNLILAVGGASEISPPRCFLLSKNLKEGSQPLMLVGKGITFDTGGINVKPFESFVNCMRNDMGGASLMANLFMALVATGYDKPVALVIPACENLVAQKSMKPGAIYQSHKGLDVAVDHTDAEGRLILADALSYGEQVFEPSSILCAATLTTSALRQYSGYQTPVHFASKSVSKKLQKACEAFGELITVQDSLLPYKWANKGKISHVTNIGRLPQNAGMGGGSNIAAHFLSEFVTKPFVHFDIFASTWNWSGDYPGSNFGATGSLFNSLFQAIRYGSLDEVLA